jgi:hypothetical protein
LFRKISSNKQYHNSIKYPFTYALLYIFRFLIKYNFNFSISSTDISLDNKDSVVEKENNPIESLWPLVRTLKKSNLLGKSPFKTSKFHTDNGVHSNSQSPSPSLAIPNVPSTPNTQFNSFHSIFSDPSVDSFSQSSLLRRRSIKLHETSFKFFKLVYLLILLLVIEYVLRQ